MMIRWEHKENRKLKQQNAINVSKLLLLNMRERPLLLFGAGARCQALLKMLQLPVALIADQIIGENIKVVWSQEIDCWSKYFTVVTCEKTDEIEKQLQGLGLKKEKDYVLAREYIVY